MLRLTPDVDLALESSLQSATTPARNAASNTITADARSGAEGEGFGTGVDLRTASDATAFSTANTCREEETP